MLLTTSAIDNSQTDQLWINYAFVQNVAAKTHAQTPIFLRRENAVYEWCGCRIKHLCSIWQYYHHKIVIWNTLFKPTSCLALLAAALSISCCPLLLLLIRCSYILAAVQPPKPTGNPVTQRSVPTVIDSEASTCDSECVGLTYVDDDATTDAIPIIKPRALNIGMTRENETDQWVQRVACVFRSKHTNILF